MSKVKLKIEKGNTIRLPKEVMSNLLLCEGEDVTIDFDPLDLVSRTYYIEPDNDDNVLDEECLRVPLRLLHRSGISLDDLHIVIVDDGLLITATEDIMMSLFPIEIIRILDKQGVDFYSLAKDFVALTNATSEVDENE